MIQLMQGGCMELMPTIPNGSVDMVMCDLPYGTTQCAWDSIIPLRELWLLYWRKRKERAAMIFTSAQPFTTALIASNLTEFKYTWTWEKNKATGHLNAKRQPLRAHEDICVFYGGQCTYNPQLSEGRAYSNSHKPGDSGDCYGSVGFSSVKDCTTRLPRTVLRDIKVDAKAEFHPTQKPVALMEYLIRTYTNEGDTVLDNCMGSGTTGVACVNTGREFIGIEKDPEYFKIAQNRIAKAEQEKNKPAEPLLFPEC